MQPNVLVSLSDVFSNKFYRIPDYQRGYAWENKQLEDYWDDLVRLIGDDSKVHYTGLLTVEPIPKSVQNDSAWRDEKPFFKGGLRAYYIIDGQQRITTSIILLKTILEQYSSEKILFKVKLDWEKQFLFEAFDGYMSYRFGYTKDMPSYEFFKTKIFGHSSTSAALVAESTSYTNNLENAKNFFLKKIKSENYDDDKLEVLFEKLTTCLRFNLYEISSDLDVFVAFETMNNRGKDLSQLELLKNRLIYLSTLLKNDRLRSSINDAWRTVYEYLGKYGSRKLVDDEFLRDHWIMYFPEYNRDTGKAYAEFLLGDYFTTKKVDKNELTADDIFNYVESIQVSVRVWFNIFNPTFLDTHHDKSKAELLRLSHLRFTSFQPLVMAAIYRKPGDQDLSELLKQVERFIFLVFYVSRRRTNTQNSSLFRKANELYRGDIDVPHVTEYLKKMIDDWIDLNAFKTYLNDLFRDNGFYSWPGLKHFLYEYELSLVPSRNGEFKVRRDEYISRSLEESIEHIFPQTPEHTDWLSVFKTYSEFDQHKLKNSLGNLLILSVSSNASASRRTFSEKCTRLNSNGENVGYSNGSYSEIKVSQDFGTLGWTADSIYARGLTLLAFLERNWDVSLGNELNKAELLGLSFLYKDDL